MNHFLKIALLLLATTPLIGSCRLPGKGKSYFKEGKDQFKYPFFEFWNKEEKKSKNDPTQTVFILVGQDLAKLPGEPKAVLPGSRALGWTVNDQDQLSNGESHKFALGTKFNAKKPTFVALYKSSATGKPIPESLKVYEFDPNMTVYLSWTKAKGLYPQTGQWGGIAGYTESCLDNRKNVKSFIDITDRAKSVFKKEFHKQENVREKEKKEKAKTDKGDAKVAENTLKARKLILKAQHELKDNKEIYPKGIMLLNPQAAELDAFAILGLPVSTRTKDNIKKAFRALSLRIHPDKHPGSNFPVATKAFKILLNANAEAMK